MDEFILFPEPLKTSLSPELTLLTVIFNCALALVVDIAVVKISVKIVDFSV